MAQLPYERALEVAQERLAQARALLQAEIADYPHPISGCDAQYVCLMSDRTRLTNAIGTLDEQPFVATPRMLEPVT